jgi:hypothetical protein
MPSVTSSLTKPSNSAFKQQRLRACQPILTPVPVILTFLVVGLIFVPLGVVFYHTSQQIREVSIRYDNNPACEGKSTCSLKLPGKIDMQGPVYMYYRLDNFYQNHRRYVKSRNDAQLRGEIVKTRSALADCSPVLSNDTKSNDPNFFFLPCGLIANTMFNDSFQLRDSDGYVELRKKGIAWPTDVKNKFKNPPPDAPGIRTITDFEDEDFIVWMRTAGLPSFSKLYRIIDGDLKGEYTVDIFNNFPVKSFNGEKRVVLTEISWLGGKNAFLGIAYMSVGAVCLALAFVFLIKHKFAGRKLGEISYLGWNRG